MIYLQQGRDGMYISGEPVNDNTNLPFRTYYDLVDAYTLLTARQYRIPFIVDSVDEMMEFVDASTRCHHGAKLAIAFCADIYAEGNWWRVDISDFISLRIYSDHPSEISDMLRNNGYTVNNIPPADENAVIVI